MGVPVSIKDNIYVKDSRTTFGSKLLEDETTTEDAPVTQRLRQAGAIIVGRTNSPEFGWKGVTDNRVFGATRNPWNTDLTPGGFQRRRGRLPSRPGWGRSPSERTAAGRCESPHRSPASWDTNPHTDASPPGRAHRSDHFVTSEA